MKSKRYYRVPAHLAMPEEEYYPKYMYDHGDWSIMIDNRTTTGLYDIYWIATDSEHEWLVSHNDVVKLDSEPIP